jgi:hypothetical protein
MNHPRRTLVTLWAAALVAVSLGVATTSCSQKRTNTEELPGITNFSYSIFTSTEHPIPAAGTFGWGPRYFKVQYLPGTNLAEVDERVRESVRAELEGRNFRFAAENPDILVGYGLAMNAPIDEAALNSMYGKEFNFTFQSPEPNESRTYHHGTFVLDFLNAETNTLLWRGIARGEVDVEVGTEIKDQRARDLAHLLIARYPDPSVLK